MLYKLSDYNIISTNTLGRHYIYNTLSRECDLLSDDGFDAFENKDINKLINEKNFESLLMKGYILPGEKDETELIESRMNSVVYDSSTLDLTFVMTHKCNLACVYCYQKGESKEFTDETQNGIVAFCKRKIKQGTKKIYINWFGGEPLVETARVISMGREIKELSEKNKVAMLGRITTNGYLLTEETFTKLLDIKVVYFMVTLDGTKELHDKQRPHKSGQGSYDVIISNLEKIKSIKRHFNIDLRVNVSKDSYPLIPIFLKEFKERFADDYRFNLVFEAVHDWKGERVESHMNLVIKDAQMIHEIYNLASKMGVRVQNYLNYRSEVQVCPAFKKNGFVISGDGKVYKCEMAMSDDVFSCESEIGKITPDGKLMCDEYKEAKWITRTKNLSMCYKCLAYPYCMGGAQCNYGLKFHHELRCKDNVEFLYWSSELVSKEKEVEIC